MITLLSTVVAPAFSAGALVLTPIPVDRLPGFLRGVTRNLHTCWHTEDVLRMHCPTLPRAERGDGEWNGDTVALVVRYKKDLARESWLSVELDCLEAVLVEWKPEVRHDAI